MKDITRNAEGHAVIISSKNQEILVDDNQWHRLSKFTWFVSSAGYAISHTGKTNNKRGFIMHRQVYDLTKKNSGIFIPFRYLLGLTPKDPQQVSHIDHNQLNNTVANLKVTDAKYNHFNWFDGKESMRCNKRKISEL
jgi:hypothetical protein